MRYLLVIFFALTVIKGVSQTTYYLTTSGGSYTSEKWVSITTGINGTGTQVWGQGNGTYSNGAGLLTDEAIDLTGYEGQTLYLNCYDKYDDSWDGTVYVLEETTSGPTIINNGGASPSDGSNDDASSSWEGTSSSNHAGELETSEAFTIPAICSAPASQASNISFSNIGLNQMDISWTRGDGDSLLVIAKAASAPSDPDLATHYSVSSTYGSGSSVGGGYAIYKGTGTSVTLTGLTAGTTYHFNVYEYNETGVCYNLDELTGSQSTLSYDGDSQASASASLTAGGTISSVNNDELGEAMDVFNFVIQDQASGDGTATKITTIRIVPGASNTADWTDHIQGALLSYNGSSVTLSSTDITDNYIDFNISSGNLDITDGETSLEAMVQIYLNSSNLSDGDVLQFMIDADNHGWTADASGSGFSSNFGTDISSNTFLVEVIATTLNFSQQPSNTVLNNSMSPAVTVETIDANGNRDIDYSGSIDITSTGTLSGTTVTQSLSSGLATFSTLTHTATGTALTLNAERNGTNDWDITSNTFDITLTPDVCADAIDILGVTATADLTAATQEDVSTNYISMGNGVTFANCNNTGHSAYIHSDFKDLWYKIDIADGADEFTVTISGSSCNVAVIPYTGSCGSLTIMDISGSSSTNTCSGGAAPFINGSGSFRFYDNGQTDIADASTGTIYLRVMGHDNGADNSAPWCDSQSPCAFTITASSPQANDVCSDALDINATTASGNIALAAADSETSPDLNGVSCNGSSMSTSEEDLWYSFTTPATGKYYFDLDVDFTGTEDDLYMVLEDYCSSGNSPLECFTISSDGSLSYTDNDLSASNTYHIRVAKPTGSIASSFDLTGQIVAKNNTCSAFEGLITDYNLSSSRTADFSYSSASGTTLPGGGSDASTKDLFYNFTSNSATIHGTVMYSGKVDISLSNISSGNYTLAVYKRDALYSPCGSLTSNLVAYQTGINTNGTYTLCTDITEGDYLVRLIQTAGTDEAVTISATPGAAVPLNAEGDYLANNTSSAQTTFDITTNSFTNEDFDLDNDGCEATTLSDNGNHITDTGKDLWYTFMTPADPGCDPTVSQLVEGISIILTSSATTGYINLELYTAIDDAAYVDEASVANGSGFAYFYDLQPSTRYYLRVEESLTLNNSQFNISAVWTNPIPCYDTGATAYDISGDFSNGPCPRDGSMTVYSMQGANAELDTDEDVWLKFTQPDNADEESFTHIRLNNVSPNFYQMEVELYEGVNDLPATKIAESPDMTSTSVYDEVFINIGNLEAGTTYFIRIVLREAASKTDNVQFNLCIFDDNGGHFNIACPSTSDGNIALTSAVECDGLAGVDGDCNLTYRINLTPITPSAWYRIEVLANEEIETPQLYGQGSILSDYDNPCNRSGVGNQVVSSGDISSPSSECSGASYGKWVAVNLIGSSSWESNIYNLWVGATAASGCLGLDLCEVNFIGPFGSQADAENGDINDVNSLYCAFFDYGDLDDGANTYPETYGIYDDENGDSYPDNGVWLGNTIDSENSGLGNADATGDDTGDGSDDEDGLTVLTQGTPGGTAEFRVVGNAVNAGTTVHVGMWIDWDSDGFESDEFYTGSGVSNSPVNIDITVNVPVTFNAGDEAKIMLKAGLSAFAFSDASGNVLNGEVEGHIISFNDAVLPIELVEFKAENNGEYNIISWQTASEENTDYFVVQRSRDGLHFEDLKIIPAAGFSNHLIDYQIIDKMPYNTTYYRLKNVDTDGEFGYSKIEVVEAELNNELLAFNIYPNPVDGNEVNLVVNNASSKQVVLTYMDLLGKTITSQPVNVIANEVYQTMISLPALESGTYLVHISANGEQQVMQLIIH